MMWSHFNGSSAKVTLVAIVVTFCYLFFSLGYKLRSAPATNSNQSPSRIGTITEYNYQGLYQDDPALVAYIRTLLQPPSTKPYNLRSPKSKHFTMLEQSRFVGDLYGPGKRDGFFVECGGNDGESSSSSLYLERELGFKGLLIEANPDMYERLVKKERKAISLNAALSPNRSSAELLFVGGGQQGHLTDVKTKNTRSVKSFPFYSILKAADVTFVDVFNLDIEGFEFKILKTIPFDKMKFGIFIVEYLNVPKPWEDLIAFMAKLGYKLIHTSAADYIFADPVYLSKLPGWKP